MPLGDPVRWALAAGRLLAGLAIATGAQAAEPEVVVSIKPVHSLVAGVMQGVGTLRLLIKGAASPHSYGLRPSDARALGAADVIFWVGADLETFLRKPLAALPEHGQVVALSQAPGMTLLEARRGGIREAYTDDKTDQDDGGQAHDGHDMHVWLDPRNAKAMVAAVEHALSARDAAHAARYRANADHVRQRLDALEAELRGVLQPVREKPYIVFHDAYQYFEARFDLRSAGSITVSPDRAPGARRLSAIRKKILDTGAMCVFTEPQFEPKLVRTVIEGTQARTAVLDPMGAALPPGPEAYFSLMRGLAHSVRQCLDSAK